MIGEQTRVAVVDDVDNSAEVIAGIAEEAGFCPVVIGRASGPFETVDALLSVLRDRGCAAAICDHRLVKTQFASFTGAELVARLYRECIPCVLVSTFTAIDSDTSIKLHRAHIPSVMNRGDADPYNLIKGLRRCEAELSGTIAPERRTTRVLVRVMEVSIESDLPVADAIMHSWNPDHAVRFPVELVEDQRIRQLLSSGFSGELRLFAEVNIGCSDDNELYMHSFEVAPKPVINEI